jgi:D-alanyl-D-alanine carboxypeptidase
MEMNMSHKNLFLVIAIPIGLVLIAVAVSRLTRSVPPFIPPVHLQPRIWGTLDQGTAQKLQAVIDTEVNLQKVPGLQAYVRSSDGKTWSGATGTRDLARQYLLGQEDVLRVGSVTKTFTAVVVLKLVEEGCLNLDDPLQKWFPDFPQADAITVRQLLNHTSGISEVTPKVIMRSIIPTTYWAPQELVDLVARDEANFTPRGTFQYSNTNYILLGIIAERISGKPIAQLLHEQIIDPLGLRHTFFVPYEQAPAGPVPGFDRDLASFPGMLEVASDNTSWATAAFTSGALASNAEDLGIFFDSLLAGELLDPATLVEMTTFIDAPNPGFSAQTGYGLGLMQLNVDDQELIGHVGWFMGSSAIAMTALDKNYTIVVTCNLSNPDLVAILAGLQDIIRQ